jgi:hypothetical protein
MELGSSLVGERLYSDFLTRLGAVGMLVRVCDFPIAVESLSKRLRRRANRRFNLRD